LPIAHFRLLICAAQNKLAIGNVISSLCDPCAYGSAGKIY
jgi:hypothetical protein